jgi:hypothetical protein
LVFQFFDVISTEEDMHLPLESTGLVLKVINYHNSGHYLLSDVIKRRIMSIIVIVMIAFVVQWLEFLAADPEVLSSIPGATTFSHM